MLLVLLLLNIAPVVCEMKKYLFNFIVMQIMLSSFSNSYIVIVIFYSFLAL